MVAASPAVAAAASLAIRLCIESAPQPIHVNDQMATLDKSFCHSEHTRFLHIAYRRKLGAGKAQLLRKEALR